MDQELSQLIARLFSVAGSKGLSDTNPITVVLDAPTTYEDTQVIIRHDEPYDVSAPLNIVWLVADDQNADYGKMLKRSNRFSAVPYQHSWTELTTYSSVFIPTQIWDTPRPDDQDHRDHSNHIDNPHCVTAEQTKAMPLSGGTMEGALNVRQTPSVNDYGDDEALPKSYIKPAIDSAASTANTANSRVGGVQGAVNYIINTLIKNLTARVVVLEGTVNDDHEPRIAALEGSGITNGFVHNQEQPEIEWTVNHALDSSNVMVQVFDDNNKLVIPSDVNIVDDNSVMVQFAIPVIGKVKIQPITA